MIDGSLLINSCSHKAVGINLVNKSSPSPKYTGNKEDEEKNTRSVSVGVTDVHDRLRQTPYRASAALARRFMQTVIKKRWRSGSRSDAGIRK